MINIGLTNEIGIAKIRIFTLWFLLTYPTTFVFQKK
jgi:hypothetical protein